MEILLETEYVDICLSEDELHRYDKAYSLWKCGQYEESISLFGRHARMLVDMKGQCLGEEKKIKKLNELLDLTLSYLREIRQLSLDKRTNNFIPLVNSKDILEEEIKLHDLRAQDTLRRMVNYPLKYSTYQDVIGHDKAKEVLTRAVISQVKHGSLWDSGARTTGVLLFGAPGFGKL